MALWTDAEPGEIVYSDWGDFYAGWDWRRGEHVTILGPTGSGKTFLMTALAEKHPDVLTLGLKPNDETLEDRLPEPRWQRIRHWPPPTIYRDRPNWVVLKPQHRKMDEEFAHQARVVRYAFRRIWEGPPHAQEHERGRWTILVPDLSIVLDDLKIGGDKRPQPSDQLKLLYKHGRSMGISMVIDAQTPAWLERLALDQPSHFFMFRPRDRDRADRFAEIGNQDKRRVLDALYNLDADGHEVLYVPTSGNMVVTVPT